ncbi:spermidine/putrescine ABC transporter substrate-binding protein [Pandoraea terrae]|uniref:Spermidine/putrescine ABC transporter substrate-binding protein n=1 Tax=Pandoraea terrae TaxID=1537710 RepID=A0A5E4YHZ8_9BURK|nr:ABC transporter substrate-binding protein [Pandoraea terrae]VVE48354.1 spermidine/putrescine ABC transporter substrate-binding protein [Pandoraea terrae]
MKLKQITACAALAAAGLMAGQAHADAKTIYIGMNGGAMEKVYTSKILPDFEKATGVKVVVVPGTSSDIFAKLQATKGKPQMHVVFLDDGVMVRAVGMGLCQKLEDSPALKQLYPVAHIKDDMAAGVELAWTGLAYNKKMFDEKGWAPPTSWMDLSDPKYKGKVVFQSASSSTFGLHGFLMINKLLGGTEKNVEPGFTKWQSTVGKNVLEYIPNSAKISEMVQTNEAAVFPLTQTGVANLKEKGIPVEYANPKEGPVLLMVGMCVVANNDNPQAAQKLAQFLLTPEAQVKAAEFGKQVPTNRTVKLPAEMQAKVGNVDELLKKINVVDWDAINANRPQWDARWNRTVER